MSKIVRLLESGPGYRAGEQKIVLDAVAQQWAEYGLAEIVGDYLADGPVLAAPQYSTRVMLPRVKGRSADRRAS